MNNGMPSHNFERLLNVQALFAPRHFRPILPNPIYLEIGAGKGKHAIDFAKKHPNTPLYAIERTAHKFACFAKAQQSQALPNLHAIHADALAWSVFALYPKQVLTCFILYPNPEQHNKNQRWHHMPFFEFLLSRMADTGQIVLASNITAYITEAKQSLQEVWHLPFVCRRIQKNADRTHFERKYLQRGDACYELIITKPADYQTRFDDFLPKALL